MILIWRYTDIFRRYFHIRHNIIYFIRVGEHNADDRTEKTIGNNT